MPEMVEGHLVKQRQDGTPSVKQNKKKHKKGDAGNGTQTSSRGKGGSQYHGEGVQIQPCCRFQDAAWFNAAQVI